MLPQVSARAGELVTLKGYAVDLGHCIASVEFSLDGGKHWTRYDTPNTNDYQVVNWKFGFTPSDEGLYVLLARSINDEGKHSPELDVVEIVVS